MSDTAWGSLASIVLAVCFFGWLAWSDWLDKRYRDDDD